MVPFRNSGSQGAGMIRGAMTGDGVSMHGEKKMGELTQV